MSHKSLAIAYSMLRKAKKKHYDEGGEVADPTPSPYETAGKTISNAVDQDKAKEFAKAFGHAKGGEVRKGINVPYHEEGKVESKIDKTLQGESTAGSHVRAANHYAEMHGEESDSDRRHKTIINKVKGEHHKTISEMKMMPNPKLKGLAKGGNVRKVHPGMEDQGSDYKNDMTRNKVDMSGGQRRGPSGYPKYQEQAQYEKGVHTPVSGVTGFPGAKGRSEAGDMSIQTYGGKPNESLREHGKELHKKKLKEIKEHPGPKLKGLARGGEVHPGSLLDESKILNDLKHEEKGPKIYMLRPTQFNKAHVAYNDEACEEDDKDLNQHEPVIMNSMKSGMVDRIMAEDSNDEHELDRYSEGGRVANECDEYAGEMPNEFDDLVLRDDLEFSYDGANSGDHLGNEQEDEDRKDIVARILKSQHKKDKLPKVR